MGVAWVPPAECGFPLFRVHFLEPRLLRKLFFAMKNQHFEVHFGGSKTDTGGDPFFKFFVIFGFIFGDPICSENLIFCTEKPTF